MKSFDFVVDYFLGAAHDFSHFLDLLRFARKELVKRRVKKSDCYGKSLHFFENRVEIVSLVSDELCKSSFSSFEVVCENHFSDGFDSVAFKEHVLCSAESDSLSAESACGCRVSRCVGICSDLEHTAVVSPFHELFKSFVEARSFRCDFAEKNFARAAVY